MPFDHHVIDLAARNGRNDYGLRWNQLWAVSGASLPTSRLEHVELWFETFAPQAKRQALVVEVDGRWVAALPLVGRRLKGVLPIWEMPYTDWTPTPQILVDQDFVNEPGLADQLIQGLRRLRRPLLRITEFSRNARAADQFVSSFSRAGLSTDVALRFETGQLNLRGKSAPENWAAYQRQLSGNFRRKIGKMLRRAESLGGIELMELHPKSPEDVERWLNEGFAIEDRSWKGAAGTSALRTPGLVDFYLRQSQLLADRSELTLLFLKHREQLIAFQCGWSAGRMYYSPKIGYDESFAHLSPGHLLMHLWIERMFAGDEFDTFDFAGPVSDSTSGWITSTYRVERFMGSTGWVGNRLLRCGWMVRQAKRGVASWAQRSPHLQSDHSEGRPPDANVLVDHKETGSQRYSETVS